MIKDSQDVLSHKSNSCLSIILNRPEVINSLSEAMIDHINSLLDQAQSDDKCLFVLFYSMSSKGFCAGGDVKELARLGSLKKYDQVDSFFRKEYGLDLRIHVFPKPVIVIADGITMGGGLGITAGAGISIATERTRMAMPETIIGFFPDIGSTGWMFTRCPKGYAEYLGLTGYEMIGSECVRLGFATHYMKSEYIPRLIDKLENNAMNNPLGKPEMINYLVKKISGFLDFNIPVNNAMDAWVKKYFAGKTDVHEILASLSSCLDQGERCNDVFTSISERSPTALVLTLKLLRHNEGKPIADVFATELKAAQFITRHPDYIEGVRARLVERNHKPRWTPDSLSKVDLKNFTP